MKKEQNINELDHFHLIPYELNDYNELNVLCRRKKIAKKKNKNEEEYE